MLPLGRRSDAFCVPLRIWSKTGTLGDSKGTPLTVKSPAPKMALVFWILVRKGTSELTGNRTCKYNVQVNVDVSTTGIRLSRLSYIVSKTVLVITTE